MAESSGASGGLETDEAAIMGRVRLCLQGHREPDDKQQSDARFGTFALDDSPGVDVIHSLSLF